MRIVAGRFRGRRLASPPGEGTRPTSDRVREALASALQARAAIEGASVLDLYAGTGALGLEALSRGARHVVAVERERRALACLRQNVAALGVQAEHQTLALDLRGSRAAVAERLRRTDAAPFSLVLADPPYAEAGAAAELLAELGAAGLLAQGAVIALEHATRSVPTLPAGAQELARYVHGDTAIALWEWVAPSGDS